MNSLQKELVVTALTNSVAHLVKQVAGGSTAYLRLRINTRDFAWHSPEIAYLDSDSRACYVPRDKPASEHPARWQSGFHTRYDTRDFAGKPKGPAHVVCGGLGLVTQPDPEFSADFIAGAEIEANFLHAVLPLVISL